MFKYGKGKWKKQGKNYSDKIVWTRYTRLSENPSVAYS